jgi:hypothetical protein
MTWLIAKYLITAALVVAISEMAKRTEKIGALLASLPLATILALIWLYVENQPDEKIADQAWYTFWYVLPTLPMFLAFSYLLPRIGFWPTLAASALIVLVCFGGLALLVRPFGIDLL